MENPKVTVAVPVLNEVKFIEQALDSLVNQTYKNIEVIIIDGGSTDGTLEKLTKYNFQTHVMPGLGQMASINKIWESSDSKYVTWMAGDDELYKNAIFDLVFLLEAHPQASFAHGPADVIDGKNVFQFKRAARNISTIDLLKSYCMLPQTGLIRRECLKLSGYTNPMLRFAADHDLYLRLSFFGYGVAASNTIARFRIHEDSEDAKNFSNVGRQSVRIIEDVINSNLGKEKLSSCQIKLAKAHSRIVCANFVICNYNRIEAFKNFVDAVCIFPKILLDLKCIKLIIRLVVPFRISPNLFRKLTGIPY
jgi:glycosyltransferase involved in cell wall biosynthesis